MARFLLWESWPLPRLTEALLDAEIPEDTMMGFLGVNWLRLWESVLP